MLSEPHPATPSRRSRTHRIRAIAVTRQIQREAVIPKLLTPRERQVLWLLVEGLSNKLIGARMGVTLHTTKFHLDNACSKLGCATRTEAAVLWVLANYDQAVARGFVTTALDRVQKIDTKVATA